MGTGSPPDTGEETRIHRAVSNDGTQIAGRVHGNGLPLVLVHAGLGDGVLDWGAAAPFLSDRFTCYLMSTRGRGSSDDHPTQSVARCVEDVTAFVESIGEPVGLAGGSGGALFALGAAARSEAVAAVAACDPLAFETLSEEDEARLHDAVERMAELAAADELVEAARDWMTEWTTDREMAALSESGYLEACATYVPVLLQLLDQTDDLSPTDPSTLQQITAPVLILYGSQSDATWPWFTESMRYIDEHVADTVVREIDGAGHMGAWVEPEAYADEIVEFFDERLS
ncbi:alpha/beta fold hydrolase [Natrononativus amylolyticus]|uniref:alpha/beta fold hydrolase n=1 Tax=Natrononativus amylolyticus TaxID=2963434 RepID=UPI0020CC93B4|nr:alpha/beta hydrolase [Natrononativus amylolyticus]